MKEMLLSEQNIFILEQRRRQSFDFDFFENNRWELENGKAK